MRHAVDVLEPMARQHITYSLRMAVGLSSKPVPRAAGPLAADDVLGNAMLESYLMHCRNLAEFLTRRPGDGKPERSTDVFAWDFFDDPSDLKAATLPSWFDMAEIHRRVAHLSTQRLVGNTPEGHFDWSLVSLGARERWVMALRSLFARFLRDLERSHPERREWFADAWDDVTGPRISEAPKAVKPLQSQGLRTVGLGRFELPTS